MIVFNANDYAGKIVRAELMAAGLVLLHECSLRNVGGTPAVAHMRQFSVEAWREVRSAPSSLVVCVSCGNTNDLLLRSLDGAA